MTKLALTGLEVSSIAYVQIGEIVASYRNSNSKDIVHRIERCKKLVDDAATLEGGSAYQNPKPKGRTAQIDLKGDELKVLIHQRLHGVRKEFLSAPLNATSNELARVIELHHELIKNDVSSMKDRAA